MTLILDIRGAGIKPGWGQKEEAGVVEPGLCFPREIALCSGDYRAQGGRARMRFVLLNTCIIYRAWGMA